jgi:hypothetical protein
MTGGTAEEFEEEFYELLHPIGRYPMFARTKSDNAFTGVFEWERHKKR